MGPSNPRIMSDTRTIMDLAEGTEEDRHYEGALNAVLHMDKRDYPSYVGGLKVASGHDYQVCSPVDSSIIFGTFQEPEDGLTDRAVKVALDAFETWSKTPADDRVAILDKALESVTRQRYRLTALLTICAGMTRDEAFDEVDRLIEVMDEACQDVSDGIKGKPQGVWAILTEYNSPLAAPIGYAVAAIAAGNTVVEIPSKLIPVPVYVLYDILVQAGLPDGVFNIIADNHDGSTNSLANNPDIAGIAAAGSGDRLENLMFMQADEDLRFINELKGMNPIVVYRPGSMKDAAKKIVRSAFAYAGQRVDSCSKVIVTENEQDRLLDALLAEIGDISVGDPAEADTDMGPIVGADKFNEFERLLNANSDYLVYGGKRVSDPVTEAGYYVTPAVLMGVTEEDDICCMDSSLPILAIQVVEDMDAAVDAVNGTEYGLCAGIITKEDSAADQFIREVNADEIFVNDPSIVIGPACKAKVECFLD